MILPSIFDKVPEGSMKFYGQFLTGWGGFVMMEVRLKNIYSPDFQLVFLIQFWRVNAKHEKIIAFREISDFCSVFNSLFSNISQTIFNIFLILS